MSGTATAIIVELSGIRDAAKQAATRPRVVPGATSTSATRDRPPLEQVELTGGERELDVMPGRPIHPIAGGRELMQGCELRIAEAWHFDQGVVHGLLRGARGCAADRDVLLA